MKSVTANTVVRLLCLYLVLALATTHATPALASPVDAQQRASVPLPGEVNAALERLAACLAGALDEVPLRRLIHQRLGGGDFPLHPAGEDPQTGAAWLSGLAQGCLAARPEAGSSRSLEEAATDVLALLDRFATIDLSLASHFPTWDPESQRPLVSFVEVGLDDSARTHVRLFGRAGQAEALPVADIGALETPVLVLEHHRVSPAEISPDDGVQRLSGLTASPMSQSSGASCTTVTRYKSYPLISQAAVFDIHEGCCNGPEGYAYFTAAGTEKAGTLPSSLGGRSGWATNVWGSNFQGPCLVPSNRMQWEWIADGWWEYALRTYPALYAQQTVTSPSTFSLVNYTINEDDEWPNGDDYVGKMQIDHRYCKSEVFDYGHSSGWTGLHTAPRIDDVKDVQYELYCSSSRTFTCSLLCSSGDSVSCGGPGDCSTCNAGLDWVECDGIRFECGGPE